MKSIVNHGYIFYEKKNIFFIKITRCHTSHTFIHSIDGLTKGRIPTIGRNNFANSIFLSNRSNLFNIVQRTSFKLLNGGEECGSKRNDQVFPCTLKLCHLFGIFNGLLEEFLFFASHGSCHVILNRFHPSTPRITMRCHF